MLLRNWLKMNLVYKVGRLLLSSGYLRTVTLEAETWLTSAEVPFLLSFSLNLKVVAGISVSEVLARI